MQVTDPPAPDVCADAKLVAELEAKGDAYFNTGSFAAALQSFETIVKCKPLLLQKLYLVACHQPDLAQDCKERIPEADVFFCGHTHGGQLQVPFYGPLITLTKRISNRVAAGGVFTTTNGMLMLLSRGVGMEGEYAPRFRINCRPHCFLVTMRATEDNK